LFSGKLPICCLVWQKSSIFDPIAANTFEKRVEEGVFVSLQEN